MLSNTKEYVMSITDVREAARSHNRTVVSARHVDKAILKGSELAWRIVSNYINELSDQSEYCAWYGNNEALAFSALHLGKFSINGDNENVESQALFVVNSGVAETRNMVSWLALRPYFDANPEIEEFILSAKRYMTEYWATSVHIRAVVYKTVRPVFLSILPDGFKEGDKGLFPEFILKDAKPNAKLK